MNISRIPQRLTAALLFAAILLQAVLPLFAANGSRQDSAQWMQVCASSGIKWIKLPGSEAPRPDSHASHDHCLLCASTGAADPFDASRHLHAPAALRAAPAVASAPAASAFAGHAILSRAPPALG